ncbi:MAG TPA: PAS domain S-box protein [Candidatus Limnocylindrales bacterium]|nr:PAS domain S-box protein [Candidatus Limnocylindrales bacterium]
MEGNRAERPDVSTRWERRSWRGAVKVTTNRVEGKPPPSTEMSKRIRVMIVDDHSVIADGLAAFMEDFPEIEVVGCAGTVEDAVSMARLKAPDVVLMDFRLPDGTGVDATAAIRHEQPGAAIVFLSVDDSDDNLRLAIEAGACGYLVKSDRGEEVVEAVHRAARGELQIPTARLNSLLLRERADAWQRAREETRADLIGTQEALQRQGADLMAARAAQGEYVRRLRSIFDSALDAVVTMDAQGRITDWNAMAERIFGWSRSEAVGRLVAETIMPERHVTAHRRGLELFLETGTAPALNQRLELEARHRDGHEFPIELSISATASGSGYVFSAFARDLTERRRDEEAVRRLAAIVECSTDAIISTDLEGKLLSWNAAAERLYGYTAEEVLGKSIALIDGPESADQTAVNIERVKQGLTVDQQDTVRRRKDGSLVDVSISMAPLTDGHGRIIAITGMTRDVSATKRAGRALRASEERYRRIVETAFEGVWMIDAHAMTTFVNRQMADMLGYTVEEVIGRQVHDFLDADGRALFADTQQLRLEGVSAQHEVRYLRKDGSYAWALVGVSPNFDATGTYVGALAMVTDITERRLAEEARLYQSRHDALTGLPNRVLLSEQLTEALEAAAANHTSVALLVMDLDQFKEVNDTFGHHAGDRLLEQVGPRLTAHLNDPSVVARLGGDEFAVLLPGADAAEAIELASTVLEELDRPFEVEGQQLDVAASIGVAIFPEDGDNAEAILRRADIALFVAKRSRGTAVSYAPEYEKQGANGLALMADLRVAIQSAQLCLHYQPLVSLRDRSLVGVEALVRWNHPERGMLFPNDFIPFAEKTRLIRPLTRWVLLTALLASRGWAAAGHAVPVAVNISARDLLDPQFPEAVAALLKDAEVAPSSLRLEITEGVIMAEPESAIETLGQLKALGVRLAVDDFGTGYSSLAYLHRLPVDEIKIDKSFVSRMAGAANRANIVRAAVDLGHSLRLETVAEGVEDGRTWDLLTALGCDTAQGYYISRGIPGDDLLSWLARWEQSGPRAAERAA